MRVWNVLARTSKRQARNLALGFLAQGDKRTRFRIHSRIRERFYIRDSLEGFASENGDIVPRVQSLSIGRHALHTDIQHQHFGRSGGTASPGRSRIAAGRLSRVAKS